MNATPFDLVFIFLGLCMAIGIIAFMVYAVKQKNSRLEIEESIEPIYSENSCAGRIGYNRNLAGPFIRLALYDEFLVVSYSKKIVLRYNEIKQVEIAKGLSAGGIKIILKNHKYPFIIVFANDTRRIINIIEQKLSQEKIERGE
jgi:hypothetical protein